MDRKKKNKTLEDDLGFGDLEDSFFASGDEAGFWDDDSEEVQKHDDAND